MPEPAAVTLFYQLKAPGGSWGTWHQVSMSESSGTYSATLAARQHGTECRWYVKYSYDDPEPENPDVTKYDPGGDTAPDDDEAYTLQWFTHYNEPYEHGLPEMLADYGGVDIRHGTDHYEFDGRETVQPELLNMVRWVLSWLGGDCCTGEYETCAETDYRSDAFHHNPRFRGGDDGVCCVPMPIHFRWSGSNVHPHYRTGGKGLVGGSTPDPRPLHNHPTHVPGTGETWGLEAARKTWRGINMLYAGEGTTFDNPFYGGGYSWGTAPGTFVLLYEPDYASEFGDEARVWSTYPHWGLRVGDVIEAVHIQELIDAVDYLIDDGVWTSTPICTRKRTPGSYMDTECGYHLSVIVQDNAHEEWMVNCEKCCANADLCTGWWPQQQLNGWYHYWGDDPEYYEDWDDFALGTCESWPTPTWAECWSDCRSDKCGLVATKTGQCWYLDEDRTGASYGLDVSCDNGQVGCGIHGTCVGCYRPDGTGGWDWYAGRRKCVRQVEGMSYFVCTPPACSGGWDEHHGGAHLKWRVDHSWPANLKATGPAGGSASGDCFGDMFACGTVYPL
ncbi:MAG TPA: hypothetical protein PLP66_16230, partial [Phycisphaerae bacterium]|nr:hypothetical protein [Phycisphaerae bacterium]